jgi:peptidoglycan-associated lipoprotein
MEKEGGVMKRINMAWGLALALSAVLASTEVVSAGGIQNTSTPPAGAPLVSAPAPQLEASPSTQMKPVHFDFDRAKLRAQDEAALMSNAIWIKANPASKIVIAGFADVRGPREYNLALAQQRALSVVDYLVKQGVRPDRLEIATYGVTDPRCTQQTEDCWARNRRVELLLKPGPPEAS